MVQRQLTAPGRDIRDPRVLKAMLQVPRHHFVTDELRSMAYEDRPLPIGYGQTISQPFIAAYMVEQLIRHHQPRRVLEVGAGSGYVAAILSHLFAEVFAMEIVEPLATAAQSALRISNCDNVRLMQGDGYNGWTEHAPFDAILCSCAPDHIPAAFVEQLTDGGRLIVPTGSDADHQQLQFLVKEEGALTQRSLLQVRFVPMTGAAQK